MKTFRKPFVFGLALVTTAAVGTLMIVGCPAGGEAGQYEVFMRSITFDPAEITIGVGESVNSAVRSRTRPQGWMYGSGWQR